MKLIAYSSFLAVFISVVAAGAARASLITSVPGPDDQGGMLMPMVSIIGADDNNNPTTGTINVNFSPGSVPVLRGLQEWPVSAGDWFEPLAAWRPDLGSPEGEGGTPAASAGNGDQFNNQYGFMFMSNPMMGMASVPSGKSLAIKLLSVSSPLLESYNYVNADNHWDQVFASPGSQVLWSGSMWHNYFTLSRSAPEGDYSATFQVFIANQSFTSGTGWADYSLGALSAEADPNFTPATVDYAWKVVPEPASGLLLGLGVAGMMAQRRRSNRAVQG